MISSEATTKRNSLLHRPSDFSQGRKVFLLSILTLFLGEDRDELLIELVIISIIVLVSVKLLTWINFS